MHAGLLRSWESQCQRCWMRVSASRIVHSQSWQRSGDPESSRATSWSIWSTIGRSLHNKAGVWKRLQGKVTNLKKMRRIISCTHVTCEIAQKLTRSFLQGSLWWEGGEMRLWKPGRPSWDSKDARRGAAEEGDLKNPAPQIVLVTARLF